jgi:hypothetical protein
MNEQQFAVSENWALRADRLQWILYKRRSKANGGWKGISFVSSRRTMLERCMREKGCPEQDRAKLLTGLPETFEEWSRTRQSSPYGLTGSDFCTEKLP